jgi:hypothetical protein
VADDAIYEVLSESLDGIEKAMVALRLLDHKLEFSDAGQSVRDLALKAKPVLWKLVDEINEVRRRHNV